jgi:2-amino-4-hydroxy-6-hydroxymethyldihydropteridine diphosphokinase
MLSKSEDPRSGNQDILIAIGANLSGPDGQSPLETCRAAIVALGALPGLRLIGVSRWYETEPVPPSGQPPYVNGIAHLRGKIAPETLLAALQAIEARAGRTRGVANAARTLDLDIIAMGDLVRAAPDPVLPHPRAHLRAFVLAPLLDVLPGWVHPLLGQTTRALLADLPPQRIRAL